MNPGSDDACGSAASGGGGGCVVGGLYCGGDKVSGQRRHALSLQRRLERHRGRALHRRLQGEPGQDDACGAAGRRASPGGLYCGGDKVSGKSGTLYAARSGDRRDPGVVLRQRLRGPPRSERRLPVVEAGLDAFRRTRGTWSAPPPGMGPAANALSAGLRTSRGSPRRSPCRPRWRRRRRRRRRR